jgi:PAS domain S-box-containing protein
MKSFSAVMRESNIPPPDIAVGSRGEGERLPQPDDDGAFVTSRVAAEADRKQAFAAVAVSSVIFLTAIPFAKVQLPQVWPFIPAYQSALVVCDVVTAALLLGQARFSRSAALVMLALGYLFTALMAVAHALSFPGLFAPGGLLGAGGQTTAWLYMFWHAGFPLTVIAYAALSHSGVALPQERVRATLGGAVGVTLGVTLLLTWVGSADSLLPAIMSGNRYTPAMLVVVSSVWLLSLASLLVVWRKRPHTVLDVWLMAVMCAWLFDIGLAAVFNGGRFDLGFYAGRVYGLAAASFVLLVLLVENGTLHAQLARAHASDRRELARQAERLRILHDIDRAIIGAAEPAALAAAVLQPLRELLGVPRVNVNLIHAAVGEGEWLAAAGRRRTHQGPGVRFPLHMLGDLQALARGEPQVIDTTALPASPQRDAMLASGVSYYMVVPMIAHGELIGALSFGGAQRSFPAEQATIAREVAAQLAIAIAQARLFERATRSAQALERQAERLRLVNDIDRAIISATEPASIAAAVIEPLRRLLEVPRAIVNIFDLAAGEVEWMAAAGRRRTRSGPGVRYPIRLMGDLEALKRGEPQLIETAALPEGVDKQALLASGVSHYMAVPMIGHGELIGAVSFGGERAQFPAEQVAIARDIANQLAIAISQARLLERVKAQASGIAERFRVLVEGVKDYAILTLDTKGCVTSWNAGAQLIKGYSSAEILGRHFSLFYPDEARAQRWPEHELEVAAAGGRFEDEGWRLRKDGSRFWANVVITAMRDEDGVLRGFSKITRDLSERKRAEEALQAANKELESFTYSVSHDLRAPLRAVDGYARMLHEDYAGRLDAEGERLLGVIQANARRMGQLIDDLLDFSRLGRQEPAIGYVDMARLAREVADELRGERPVEIGALPTARADSALIKQVWINLIGNALKYSAKKSEPRVEVGAREESGQSVYWVRDNGAGFDMRYAAKLFGVFQRLHRADEFEGTGVGLAIVQRVVSRHGGRVWAEAKPGEGACFFFSLPRVP